MKSNYIKGIMEYPSFESPSATWSAHFYLPIYDGRLYISSNIAALLLRAKKQRLPIIVGKQWKGERI